MNRNCTHVLKISSLMRKVVLKSKKVKCIFFLVTYPSPPKSIFWRLCNDVMIMQIKYSFFWRWKLQLEMKDILLCPNTWSMWQWSLKTNVEWQKDNCTSLLFKGSFKAIIRFFQDWIWVKWIWVCKMGRFTINEIKFELLIKPSDFF